VTSITNLPLPTGYDSRSPQREDAEAIAALITAARKAVGDDEVASAEDVLDDWQGVDLATEAIVVANADGQIVGNADILNRRNMRVSVYGSVAPVEQGHGVGTFLVRWGEEWARESAGLPLPLGINVMRRDLGDAMHRQISQALRDSIDFAHTNVDEALEYAMRYGRGIDKETCRRFVLMYVNEYTKRLGDEGRAALSRLYALAHSRGLISAVPPVDPI